MFISRSAESDSTVGRNPSLANVVEQHRNGFPCVDWIEQYAFCFGQPLEIASLPLVAFRSFLRRGHPGLEHLVGRSAIEH